MPSRSIAPFTEAEHKVFCRPKLAILVNVGGWAQARVAAQSADVRFGSLADMGARPQHVRFTPESGHWLSVSGCPLCATTGRQRHSCWHRAGLGLSSRLQDQLRDFLWMGDQRKMTGFHFDGLGPHALSHETLEIGVDRAIFCRHSVPTRL